MEAWNGLIRAALLGTGKTSEGLGLLAALPTIADVKDALKAREADVETALLDTTALLYAYRRCGVQPLTEKARMEIAEVEQKPYCSDDATRVLSDILQTGSTGLLQFWLTCCDEKASIIPPLLLAELLQFAKQHKVIRPLLLSCCGKRGEWLCRLNPEWTYHTEGSDAERWETGTLPDRVAVLKAVRATAPATAREMLEGVWSVEKADVKEALLQVMEIGLSEADLPFLEELTNDKSKRVLAIAYDLLMRIPSSSIVRAFEEELRGAVKQQTTKKLLGMMSKTSLEIIYPKVSDKRLLDALRKKPDNISEEEFHLLKMIANVPPQFWEVHFSLPPQRVLELFKDVTKESSYKDALRDATIRFKNAAWGALFKNETEAFKPALLPLLSPTEQKEYLASCVNAAPGSVIDYYSAQGIEWDATHAPTLMRFAATNPYQYNKGFFNAAAHLIPLRILPVLESLAPKVDATKQDYTQQYAAQTWQNTCEHIKALLTLKLQTVTAFFNQEQLMPS